MPHTRRPVQAVLGFVGVAASFSNLHAAPGPDHVLAMWALGPAVVAGATFPARRRLAWAGVVGLAAGAAYATVGAPLLACLVAALGAVVVTAWASGRLSAPEGLTLHDDRGLLGLLVSSLLIGLAAGAHGLLMVLAGWGSPALLPVAYAAVASVSVLALVPVVGGLPDHAAVADAREATAQWGLLLTLTTLALLPTGPQTLALIALPSVFAWAAVRLRPRTAMVQVYVVLVALASASLVGSGGLVDVGGVYDLDVDQQGLLLVGYSLLCVLVATSLMLFAHGQHERTDRAARERDLLQQVLEATPGVAIVGTDAEDRIIRFNVGAERLLGHRTEDVLGRPRATVGASTDDLRALLDGAAPGEGAPLEVTRADGRRRTHHVSLAPLRDRLGRVYGHLSTSEDITSQVETTLALERALDHQKRIEAAREAFLTTASHELRTPLASVMGNLELVEDGAFGDPGEELRAVLARVFRSAERLSYLVDGLTLLSSLHSRAESDRELLDLRDCLERAWQLVLHRRPDADAQLVVPTDPVPVLGREDDLVDALARLVDNAVKFGREGPVHVEVHVEVHEGEGRAEVAITDQGIGIPADDLAVILEPFGRGANASRQQVQGAGLGLPIATAVLAEHDGSVDLQSQEGVGTTVRVSLPVSTGTTQSEPAMPQ